MKLSELVDYLNLLEQDEHNPDYVMAMKKFESMIYVVKNHPIQIEVFKQELSDRFDQVYQSFDQVQNTIDEIKDKIRIMIDQREESQFEQSQRLYSDEMCYETDDYILNRRLAIDDDSNILLRAHLKNYSDWRLPGLIIRPGKENFIEDLVPLDPLYLADHNLNLLKSSIEAFTVEYQRRLRPYDINDYQYADPLWQLPDNQFGLIFSYNYFNYKPIDVIRRYLNNMYQKLRPGGVTIFTYNNCDYAHGTALAEKSFMCYTPGRLVRLHAESQGFEVVFEHRGQGDVAWIELRKPGEIESIRGGQSLAKIVANQ
jgi:SAM-dependent methyltransferase